MNNNLIKKESKIHGLGIFTNKNIKKGETFYQVPMDDISDIQKSQFAFIGNNQWVNDPLVLNWVNHSCCPNTILEIKKRKPILISKRDIGIGEEITCDYNKTEKGGNKISCNCAEKNCKGFFIRLE